MRMKNRKPCMKCGGMMKKMAPGGMFDDMPCPPESGKMFNPATGQCECPPGKKEVSLTGNCIDDPFDPRLKNIQFNSNIDVSKYKCPNGYDYDLVTGKCQPLSYFEQKRNENKQLDEERRRNPLNFPTFEELVKRSSKPKKFTFLDGKKLQFNNPDGSPPCSVTHGDLYVWDFITKKCIVNTDIAIQLSDGTVLRKKFGCRDDEERDLLTGECVPKKPKSTETTTTLPPDKYKIPGYAVLEGTNRALNILSNFAAQNDQNRYLEENLNQMSFREPRPYWSTNEQGQVPGYNLYFEEGGIVKFKQGGKNMNKSITTETTKPYIPLSQDELSALAHQFRGMGSDKSTYAMIPQGSGIDNIGYLTPRERKQLSDYMNSRNALQSIWEGLPNLLGASGAAALPESSRLIKDRIMRNSYFPGKTGYADWLNYMENKGYKLGGSTNNKTNNMIKIKEENKGKFTAQARKAGMGVQEFANYVLGNPDEFSAATAKRANFAKNAAGWKKEFGGMTYGNPYYGTFQDGGPMPMEGAPMQGAPMEGGAPGGDQLQQIIQMIIEALQEGMSPEEVLQALVQMGIPQEQAAQLLQAVMERMQQVQGQMEAQGQMEGQAAPPMRRGGYYQDGGMTEQEVGQMDQTASTSDMMNTQNTNMNMIIKAYSEMKGIPERDLIRQLSQLDERRKQAALRDMLSEIQMAQQSMEQGQDQGMMRAGGMISNYR